MGEEAFQVGGPAQEEARNSLSSGETVGPAPESWDLTTASRNLTMCPGIRKERKDQMAKGCEDQAKGFTLSPQVLGSQCRVLSRGVTQILVIERSLCGWYGGWFGRG